MNARKWYRMSTLAFVVLALFGLTSCAGQAARDTAQWRDIQANQRHHNDVEQRGEELSGKQAILEEQVKQTQIETRSAQERANKIAEANEKRDWKIRDLKRKIGAKDNEIRQARTELAAFEKQGDSQGVNNLKARIATLEGEREKLQKLRDVLIKN